MGSGRIYCKGVNSPKRRRPGGDTGPRLSAYEQIVSLYSVYHREFGWTPAEIDEIELDYLMTLLRVTVLTAPDEKDDPNTTHYYRVPDEKIHYIDEVL